MMPRMRGGNALLREANLGSSLVASFTVGIVSVSSRQSRETGSRPWRPDVQRSPNPRPFRAQGKQMVARKLFLVIKSTFLDIQTFNTLSYAAGTDISG